jgi:hypothetical protein
MTYQCYRCFYKTNKKNNIIYHFNRKKKCIRHENCFHNDDEIVELNEKQFVEKEQSEEIICELCNKNFKYLYNLTKHNLKYHCNEEKKNIINNTQNNINITNIILNVNNLIPFEEDWDLSKISSEKKNLLIFSKIMYTALLEEILKNEINLNVIIDKDTNSGLVFSNENSEKKYINMDYKKIINESMKKLNKNLITIYNEAVDNNLDHLENCKVKINEKYENFIENKDVQKIVSNYLTNIYDNKKEEALKIMKDVVIDDNELDGY